MLFRNCAGSRSTDAVDVSRRIWVVMIRQDKQSVSAARVPALLRSRKSLQVLVESALGSTNRDSKDSDYHSSAIDIDKVGLTIFWGMYGACIITSKDS